MSTRNRDSNELADREGEPGGGEAEQELAPARAPDGSAREEGDGRADTKEREAGERHARPHRRVPAGEQERNDRDDRAQCEEQERRDRRLPRRAAERGRLDAELLPGQRVERRRAVGEELRGDAVGLAWGEPLCFVDELQLLALALGVLGQLARLDADLALRELARAGDRDPLAERHRAR